MEQVQALAEEGDREQAREHRQQVHEHAAVFGPTRDTALFQKMYPTTEGNTPA